MEQVSLHSRNGGLVHAQGPGQRKASQARHELGLAHDDPRLRPSQQLVSTESDQVRALCHALLHGGLVRQAIGG